MAQNIYDDPQFFEGYSQFRRSREGLAGAAEWPVVRSMLPPMQELRILDLGCGFGAFARWAREMGAASVLGLDLSEKMLARAQALTQDPGITYRRANIGQNIEQLGLAGSTFDLVYSALALHYIEDFGAICATVQRLLVPGGTFFFTIEHPIYTAPSNPEWQTDASGDKVWPLNNYLLEGERITDWITQGVVKQHRTIASYVNSLIDHNFRLLRLEEWGPTPEQIAENPEWADELHRPPFLLVLAQS